MKKLSLGLTKEGRISPYQLHIPVIARPKGEGYHKPETYEDKLYCWFYWIDAILNPETTRWALENFEYAPEMKVSWSKGRKSFRKSYQKTHGTTDIPKPL